MIPRARGVLAGLNLGVEGLPLGFFVAASHGKGKLESYSRVSTAALASYHQMTIGCGVRRLASDFSRIADSERCHYRKLKLEQTDDGDRPRSEARRYCRPFGGVGKAESSCLALGECGRGCNTKGNSSGRGATPPLRTLRRDRGILDELSRSVARHDRFATASAARSDDHGFPSLECVGCMPHRKSRPGPGADTVVLRPEGVLR